MRIGIYDPYLDDLGGGEKYMMTIAECLAVEHDVTVFWDNKSDLEQVINRFSLMLEKVKIEKNIFSTKVSLAKRLFATKKYEAIIMLTDGSIPIVASKKLFLHAQQPLGDINNSSWNNKLKLLRVTGVFYNSLFTKSFNDKIFTGVRSRVIYPPVNVLQKNLEKENMIMHVGRFRVINVKNEDYKKQQLMVNAFKRMVDTGLNNWRFVVATSTNNESDPRFKELLKSAKNYPVEFMVNKSNKELWDTYNKAKIYWHASGYDEDLNKYPEYAEHFGISTVEAMGAGAVPVVINAGGQKEIITDKENGFLWNDIDGLISKTTLLINDKNTLKKMSESAIIRSGDFSKEKFCQELHKLIA